MSYEIINNNCLNVLESRSITEKIDLTFLDPPFNQQKDYAYHNDDMTETDYWNMMLKVCKALYKLTNKGEAVYLYPEIPDDTLNFIIPYHTEDDKVIVMKRMLSVFGKRESEKFKVFPIKHHFNGYFLVFQLHLTKL